MSTLDINQTEILKELKRDITVDVFYQNIIRLFKDNKTKLADYIIFLFRNNILQREERLVFGIILIRLTNEINLKNHLKLIYQIISKNEDISDILLFHDILVLKNIQKYKNRKLNKLDSFVNSLSETQNIKSLKQALTAEINLSENSGPDLESETFIISSQVEDKSLLLDNFINKEEFIRRTPNFDNIRKGTIYKPDFLIPEPEEIPFDNSELLICFPIIIESPIINPCIRKNLVVLELLEKTGKLNNNELKVLIEIIGMYPDCLSKKYFFDNLQRLVNQDSDLVSRICIILAEKKKRYVQRLFNRNEK